jgi:hypothetical protein
MADLNAARRHRAMHRGAIDIEALRRAARRRLAGRPTPPDALARRMQLHAEAVGRGDHSVSPAAARKRTLG